MRLLCLIKFYANIGIASLAMSLSSAYASPVEDAGEVTFSLGRAFLNGDELIKVGSKIHEGDVIETLGNGHVHIRFADNGLVSVRPDSRLSIEHYSYDPEKPSDSVIKFDLNEGVMRSISGTGAKAARDKFRLNTPIAAIGVRGTDFVVKASNDLVQAIVNEGAIVVAPFSNNCNAGSVGPCSDSVELDSTTRQLLELSSLYGIPRLVPLSTAFAAELGNENLKQENQSTKDSENSTNDESKSDKNNSNESTSESTDNDGTISQDSATDISYGEDKTNSDSSETKVGNSLDESANDTSEDNSDQHVTSPFVSNNKASDTEKRENSYSDMFSNDMSDDEVKSLISDIAAKNSLRNPNSTDKLAWGRFTDFPDNLTNKDTIIGNVDEVIESGFSEIPDYARTEINGSPIMTGIFRTPSDRTILDRSLGTVEFSLKESQANLYLKSGDTESMSVSNEFLTVDFTKGSFATGMTLNSLSASNVEFRASGTISSGKDPIKEGELQLNKTSEFSGPFHGATTLDGDEAGYIFYKDVEAGRIESATIWKK